MPEPTFIPRAVARRAPVPFGQQPPPPLWRSVLKTARPRQWVKNFLVFAAPAAAGVLTHPTVAIAATSAVVCFSIAASATYFVNDTLDREGDRLHARKRKRPIAAGHLSPSLAMGIGIAAAVLSIILAFVIDVVFRGGHPGFVIVIAAYLTISFSYARWLRHEPVLDLAAVASGFVLRAIAGGVVTGVPLSQWFLLVASFGALFIVAGKRQAERHALGADGIAHRSTLGRYSRQYLASVQTTAQAVTIAAYCLWAFQRAQSPHAQPLFFELSIVPFVLALLRYDLVVDAGGGGAPEDVAFGDRVLQGLGVAWIVIFGLGVYGF